MVATLMVHLRIMKIHKNPPGDIANIFPYQHFIPLPKYYSIIEKLHSQIIFYMLATQMVHPRKFTETCPEILLIISQNFEVNGCMVFESIEYRQTDKQTHIHFYIRVYRYVNKLKVLF